MEIPKESIEYLSQFMKVDNELKEKILKHCKRYNLKPEICAYYFDWEDFCSDWCDEIGYTRTEARKLLHGGKGEFLKFDSNEIIRFTLVKIYER